MYSDCTLLLLTQTVLQVASRVKDIFAHSSACPVGYIHGGFWRGLTLQVPGSPSKRNEPLTLSLMISKVRERLSSPPVSSLSRDEEAAAEICTWNLVPTSWAAETNGPCLHHLHLTCKGLRAPRTVSLGTQGQRVWVHRGSLGSLRKAQWVER